MTCAYRRLIAIGLACILIGCGGSAKRPLSRLYAAGVSDVTAIVVLPDSTLRVTIRARGIVEDISTTGGIGATIARVEVRSDGQRGLLGLAVDSADRTFASWTTATGRIVVAQVAPGSIRLVWNGPRSTDLANGGHLALRENRLIIGIGDLLHNDLTHDPRTINGKIVSLDPEGPPNQTPKLVSSGWNNPFAFTVLANTNIWVADNSPGDTGERLIRGDIVTAESVELPHGTAPVGIADVGGDELVICGYKSGSLLAYRLVDGRPRRRRILATDCRGPVVALPNGQVVYAAADGLRILTP